MYLLADLVTAFFAIGFVFGVAFVIWGVERVDPVVRGASAAFRLSILPGVAALWPLMLVRWIRSLRERA